MGSYLKRVLALFFSRKQPATFLDDSFETHLFFTAHKAKTERLAAIARERDALKDELAKVIKAKKARAPIYAKLRALSIEELTVEGRR